MTGGQQVGERPEGHSVVQIAQSMRAEGAQKIDLARAAFAQGLDVLGHLGHGLVPVDVNVAVARPGHVGHEHGHVLAFQPRFQHPEVRVLRTAGVLAVQHQNANGGLCLNGRAQQQGSQCQEQGGCTDEHGVCRFHSGQARGG